MYMYMSVESKLVVKEDPVEARDTLQKINK